jgi:aspartate/glutamate racemase
MTHASRPEPGPELGIIMLSTRFPRPAGDIGNPDSFTMRVAHEIVPSARVSNVVSPVKPESSLLEALIDAARNLEARGVRLITTGCGFLGAAHDAVQAGIETPFASSSLMLVEPLRRIYGSARPIGILTFDADALRPHHFPGGYDAGVVIRGVEGGREIYRVIREDLSELDTEAACEDTVTAARQLIAEAPDLSAILMECTNLPPYRAAVERAVQCPVYDVHSLIHWFSGRLPADSVALSTIP